MRTLILLMCFGFQGLLGGSFSGAQESSSGGDPPPTRVPLETEPEPEAEDSIAEDPEDGDPDNPFFDVEDLPTAPWWEQFPVKIRGRADLTVGHFEDSRNVDDFDRDFVNTLDSALMFEWEFHPGLRIMSEIEYDGIEGEVELDQLLLRVDTPIIGGSVDLGVNYVPFGIERFYAVSTNNPLVDRPSPFRRIFPGTYSDVGGFVRSEYAADSGWKVRLEAAVTRGLRGPERDDRRDDLLDSTDEPQLSGRLGLDPVPWLSMGVSGLLVWIDDHDRHRRLDLVGADVTWRPVDDFYVRWEYVGGGVENEVSVGGSYRRHGWYVETYKKFPIEKPWLEAFEVALRFDSLDENSDVRDFRDVDRWAFGLNWLPHPHVRFKSEFVVSDEHFHEISNNGFFFQVHVHF